jgi:hypothetical protein
VLRLPRLARLFLVVVGAHRTDHCLIDPVPILLMIIGKILLCPVRVACLRIYLILRSMRPLVLHAEAAYL